MASQMPSPEEIERMSHDDRATPLWSVSVALLIISSILSFLRVSAQRLARGKVGVDDYCTIIAWTMVTGCTICAIISFRHGMGKHTVTILMESPDPLKEMLIALKCGYAVPILWGQSMLWVKLSLLALYHRIFAVGNPTIRLAIWMVLGYVISVGIVVTFDEIFTCLPVSYFWASVYIINQKPPPVMGSCLSLVPRSIAMQALNIVGDFLILLLPLWGLWNLQMPRRRKFSFSGVFVLGTLATVVSIVRIPYTISATVEGADLFWDDAWSTMFVVLEINGALICASLPCLRPLWAHRKELTSYFSSGKLSYAYGSKSNPAAPSTDITGLSGRRDITVTAEEGTDSLVHSKDPGSYIQLADWEDVSKRNERARDF